MNDWDDLDQWVDEEIEKELVRAKTEAADIFLTSVTSPTNQNPKKAAYGAGGNTPVLTGDLIANTEVGINTAPDGKNSSEDPDGMSTYMKGKAQIRRAKAYDTIYFVNATDYNIQAEFEGWSYTKPYRYWQLSYNDMLESIK